MRLRCFASSSSNSEDGSPAPVLTAYGVSTVLAPILLCGFDVRNSKDQNETDKYRGDDA